MSDIRNNRLNRWLALTLNNHWLILIVVATVLRAINLGSESLWFDETFTWLVAKQTTTFWQAVFGDDHPPLWSMIQWVNIRILGGSEAAFRVPSLLFSVGCVILVWKIALALRLKPRSALCAGLIAACLPASIYFGQDGRMYAALAFFLLLAVWAALEWRWAIMAIACVLAVYTQNAAIMYVIALAVGVLSLRLLYWIGASVDFRLDGTEGKRTWLDMRQRYLTHPLAAFIVVLVIWLPWLPMLLIMSGRVQTAFWAAPMNGINWLWLLVLDSVGWRIPDLLQTPLYALIIALTAISLWLCRSWLYRMQNFTVLITALGGPALLAIYSIISAHSVYVFRPMFVTALLACILWVAALEKMSASNRNMFAALLLVTLIIGDICHYTNHLRGNVPEYLAPVTSAWQPGDCAYFTNAAYAILFEHYLPGKPAYIWPYHGNVMSATDEDQAAFGMIRVRAETLGDDGVCERAWYFMVETPFTEPYEKQAVSLIFGYYGPDITFISESDSPLSLDYIYLIKLGRTVSASAANN